MKMLTQRREDAKSFCIFVPLCAFRYLLLRVFAHDTRSKPTGSHSTRVRASMSAEAKALVEEAIGVVCTQAKLDPKSSVAIDEMQARPSLPVQSPEARAGAERAQRLLPLAKTSRDRVAAPARH